MREEYGSMELPPPGSEQDMTEAQLAVLEAKGLTVRTGDFTRADPNAIENGALLFEVGSDATKDSFRGRILERSTDQEKIYLWQRNTGEKVLLPKIHILYYIESGRCQATPVIGKTDANPPLYRCPSKMSVPPCTKMSYTLALVEDHMRGHHGTEYKMNARHRELTRERQMDEMMESLARGDGNNQLLQAIIMLNETMRAGMAAEAEASPMVGADGSPAEVPED